MDSLTVRQAYAAMYAYLETLYERTESDDLGGLLGSMSLLEDEGTADPAAWSDWLDAVQKVTGAGVNMELDLK